MTEQGRPVPVTDSGRPVPVTGNGGPAPVTGNGQPAAAGNGQPVVVSRWTDIDGPVHYLDYGGPADGPVIVCVHGLGGSAVNWLAIAPLLTGCYRLLAPDLAGHGLTRSAGRGVDVAANRALLHRFIETVAGGGPVILMGNSMGGMISLLETAAAPATVAGLILVDPALPFRPSSDYAQVAAMFAAYATPGVGQLLNRRQRQLTAEDIAARVLALCCVDPSRVPPDVVAQHVDRGPAAGRLHRRRPGLHRCHPLGRRHRRVQPRAGLPAGHPVGELSGTAAARQR